MTLASRQLAALEAARLGHPLMPYGDPDPSAWWQPVWATGSLADQRCVRTLTGHNGQVAAVSAGISGGRFLAVSGGSDGVPRLWDVTNGQASFPPQHEFRGAIGSVALREVSGRPIAFTATSGTAYAWDLFSESIQPVLSGAKEPFKFVSNTERDKGTHMLLAFHNRVEWWDLADDQRIRRGPIDDGTHLFWQITVEGRVVLVTGDRHGTIGILDGWSLARLAPSISAHRGAITALSASMHDGCLFITSAGTDGRARLWNGMSGQQVGETKGVGRWHVTSVRSAYINGQQTLVTAGEDARIALWDAESGDQCAPPLVGHTDQITCLDLMVEGDRTYIVSAAADSDVRVWDVQEPVSPSRRPGHRGHVTCMHSDDRSVPVLLTGGGDGFVRRWRVEDPDEVCEPLLGGSLSFNTFTATAQNDTQIVITADSDEILIYNESGEPSDAPLTGHTGEVTALATATVDGRRVIVSGGDDHTVRLWDLARQSPVGEPLTGHEAGVLCVATAEMSGAPVALTGAMDCTVRVWNLGSHSQLGAMSGHTGWVWSVTAATLGGRLVAVSASADRTARIWDVFSERELFVLTGHTDVIFAVCTGTFNGHSVVFTGSHDRTVRTWDLRTGRQLGETLWFPHPVRALSTAAGDCLAIGFDWDVAVFRLTMEGWKQMERHPRPGKADDQKTP
ncbi:WD40 repeat domain-containing protein [Streptomyces bobili]|uniref:WD40 repeat domain-containing protein n=1 Tax=Streptomyces bobili TaxID=67280 RepID=UPI00380ED3E8